MTETTAQPAVRQVGPALVETYRRDGFVRVPRVFEPERVQRFREAALAVSARSTDNRGGATFQQVIDVWRVDGTLRELVLDPGLGAIAEQLAGVPLRLWHDHMLIKPPHNGAATEFHQDGPYWPHSNSRHALSAWVALVDVPFERGCMSFIPGSHIGHRDLRPQDLTDSEDLFRLVPELAYEPRVTVPLRAGDCTFHNSFTAHTAAPNATDDPRIAQVVIWVDAEAQYSGSEHVITDDMGLTVGAPFPDDRFPRVIRP